MDGRVVQGWAQPVEGNATVLRQIWNATMFLSEEVHTPGEFFHYIAVLRTEFRKKKQKTLTRIHFERLNLF